MIFRIVGGVGALLAIVATLLKISAIALPNFVDVHIVSDLNDVAEANRIAQVGVYQSILDTTQEPQLALANEAGIGPLKIEASSTEFKVLFPAQENFAADLNPLDKAAVEQINGLIEQATGTANVGDSLNDEIEALEALGFDNCEGYFDDYIPAQAAVFNAFTQDVLPDAVVTISLLLSQGLSANAAGLNETVFVETVRTLAIGTAVGTFNVLVAAEEANACTGLELTSLLNAQGRLCASTIGVVLSTENEDTGFVATALGPFVDAVFDACADEVSIIACIQTMNAEFGFTAGTELRLPVPFDSLNFCGITGGCAILAQYMGFAALLAKSSLASGTLDAEQTASVTLFLQGVGIHVNGVLLGQLTNFDPAEGDAATIGNLVFGDIPSIEEATIDDTDFGTTVFIAPCDLLNVALEEPDCVNIVTYFNLLGPVLNNANPDLFAQVEGIVTLYAQCFAIDDPAPLPAGACGTVGANAVAGEVFGVNITANPDVLGDLVDECEEDEIDKEKVGEAQVWVAVSSAVGMLGLLVILVSLCLSPGVSMFTFGCGGFLALVAGITIFVALAVVASAPVFEGVGEPPAGDEAEIVFVAGIVGKLAVADGALHIVAGLTCFVAACLSFTANKNESDSAGVYEGKGDKPVAAQGEDMEDKL